MDWSDQSERIDCPCCGYPTLGKRGAFDICELCWWEDDGQTEAQTDEARDGPNHGYSLAQARENFRRFLVMYAPEHDPRIAGPDGADERETKQALMEAFDGLKGAAPSERPAIIASIRSLERKLRQEVERKIQEYEAEVRRRTV